MLDHKAISTNSSPGVEWMKSTSCWKWLLPWASVPMIIWKFVNRCMITNTPTGTIPDSECSRRSRK